MLQQHYGLLLGVTAMVFLLLGIWISPAFAQRRRLNRAIKALTERYNAEIDRSRVERQAWNSDRTELSARLEASRERLVLVHKDLSDERQRAFQSREAFGDLHSILKHWLSRGVNGLHPALEIVKKQLGI